MGPPGLWCASNTGQSRPRGQGRCCGRVNRAGAGRAPERKNARTPIEPTWAVDATGAPTTDPAQAEAAVPLGGYKGYGLGLLVEILSGVFSGSGLTRGIGRMYDEWDRPQDVGHFFLVLDPERIVGRRRFAELLDGLLAELKAIPPAPGFDEVLVPGEREDRMAREREALGIPLPTAVRQNLDDLSAELGISAPRRGGG
jgi:ureidoglycolate dehydrogenase (NAD+)